MRLQPSSHPVGLVRRAARAGLRHEPSDGVWLQQWHGAGRLGGETGGTCGLLPKHASLLTVHEGLCRGFTGLHRASHASRGSVQHTTPPSSAPPSTMPPRVRRFPRPPPPAPPPPPSSSPPPAPPALYTAQEQRCHYICLELIDRTDLRVSLAQRRDRAAPPNPEPLQPLQPGQRCGFTYQELTQRRDLRMSLSCPLLLLVPPAPVSLSTARGAGTGLWGHRCVVVTRCWYM